MVRARPNRNQIEDLTELIRGCRTGDGLCWAQFLQWFGGAAKRVLNRFPNLSEYERSEAEDSARASLSSEIMSGRIRGSTHWEIRAFVQTVVTNCARDVWRKRRSSEP